MDSLIELFGLAALELTAIGFAVVVIGLLSACVIRRGFRSKSPATAPDGAIFDRTLIAEMVRQQIRPDSRTAAGMPGSTNRSESDPHVPQKPPAVSLQKKPSTATDTVSATTTALSQKKRLLADPYVKARRLADCGHDPDRIAIHVGIPVKEADLVVKLRRMIAGRSLKSDYRGQPAWTSDNAH